MQRVGSRLQVMRGSAKMTGGGLRKKDLTINRQGKIVSKKLSKKEIVEYVSQIRKFCNCDPPDWSTN